MVVCWDDVADCRSWHSPQAVEGLTEKLRPYLPRFGTFDALRTPTNLHPAGIPVGDAKASPDPAQPSSVLPEVFLVLLHKFSELVIVDLRRYVLGFAENIAPTRPKDKVKNQDA